MPAQNQAPEAAGTVADSVGNWVDRLAPAATRPYLRLSRADRPAGTWLLLLPCWWSVLLASLHVGSFSWTAAWAMIVCAIGAFLMRAAGCTWNDITDRKYDAQVARTRSRPLPSGQVTVKQAAIWMVVQALVAFGLLLTLHPTAIMLGVLSLAPVCVYPFAKRFTWWPQVFLGIAFNWGALLGWAAVTESIGLPAILLYLSGMAWTIFYDTIYAHQDADDDALIGVKSTARLFGENSPRILRIFMVLTVLLMGASIVTALPEANVLRFVIAFGAAWAMAWHLVWQLLRLDINDPANCLHLFRANRDAGLLPVLFFAGALFV
ncbi:4-hydroxybenzoate octaprenyltransferase [Donghicola mangrovi]|uniref:4-hydroxybenzoate octaprenyltransferase n=1 Tax=Donghicola mangrovi TaxID=2729614 RepID=A0A850Q476_9RHOB|nr:4-hydroxybenzoate octaprenyltransferase [Donghicola mangrovi]NVO21878.1 4-hydroxybenzoate octaprenyltransferase [Donghicola mangrovi]